MARLLVYLLNLLCCSALYAQSSTQVAQRLVGTWDLVSHQLGSKEMLSPDMRSTYVFRADSTYQLTAWYSGNGSVVTVGKWKVAADGRSLLTWDNRFLPPHDQDGVVADHPLKIISLTATRFATNEHLFSESRAGTSYYERR